MEVIHVPKKACALNKLTLLSKGQEFFVVLCSSVIVFAYFFTAAKINTLKFSWHLAFNYTRCHISSCSLVPEKRIFKCFYYLQAWPLCWSCDLDHFRTLIHHKNIGGAFKTLY